MRRTVVPVLAALVVLGAVTPGAVAQAPTPIFQINGLIDQVGTYTRNMSRYDLNLARNKDAEFYGRTRGRFDFSGEYGTARGVLGIEIDSYYGQTGSQDSNNFNCISGATPGTVGCATQGLGSESAFDLNTDTEGNLQVKWLYAEFEVPLIPVPTVVRLGAQPLGGAANYKLGTYANGDFGGVHIASTVVPNVRLLFTYVAVEELLTGKKDIASIPADVTGFNVPQSRGDDFALILSAEVTPIKGLDLKPMYSYFYASGVTSAAARQGRGGFVIAASTAPNGTAGGSPFAPKNVSGADGVGTGIGENRHTIGLDGRWRIGEFSLEPTVLYQFGGRDAFNTVTPAYGILCNSSGAAARNCTKQHADLSAWMLDIRGGYQLGPLLMQGLFLWTSGNRARDTLLKNVNFFQPIDTDTSYLADWGTQITSLGVDYYQILNALQAGLVPGSAIGYDKYGRTQLGLKASYALTTTVTFGGGWTILWTDRKVDTDGTLVGNGGILPSFVDRKTGRSAAPEGDAKLIGNELNATAGWRFGPGVALEWGLGYLFAGGALGHRTVGAPYCDGSGSNGRCTPPNKKDIQVNDVFITTVRARFTF